MWVAGCVFRWVQVQLIYVASSFCIHHCIPWLIVLTFIASVFSIVFCCLFHAMYVSYLYSLFQFLYSLLLFSFESYICFFFLEIWRFEVSFKSSCVFLNVCSGIGLEVFWSDVMFIKRSGFLPWSYGDEEESTAHGQYFEDWWTVFYREVSNRWTIIAKSQAEFPEPLFGNWTGGLLKWCPVYQGDVQGFCVQPPIKFCLIVKSGKGCGGSGGSPLPQYYVFNSIF